MPSCVWVRVPSLAQKSRGTPRLFSCELRASWLSFPSVTNVTSPQGEYTSPTFGRSHALRTAEDSLDHLFQCELGPRGFVPLCHYRDISPGRIYVSDVWSLARSQNSRSLPRPPLSVRARASRLLPSVTDVTSPQGEYTSPTFGRSHLHRTAEGSLDHFSVRASGGLIMRTVAYSRQDAQRLFHCLSAI